MAAATAATHSTAATAANLAAAGVTATHKSAHCSAQMAADGATQMACQVASQLPAVNASLAWSYAPDLSTTRGARVVRLPVTRSAAAPAIPTIAATPAYSVVPSVTAPVPAGALPSVVIPAIILVIEDELRQFYWSTLD
jgi:hypothetical protein